MKNVQNKGLWKRSKNITNIYIFEIMELCFAHGCWHVDVQSLSFQFLAFRL